VGVRGEGLWGVQGQCTGAGSGLDGNGGTDGVCVFGIGETNAGVSGWSTHGVGGFFLAPPPSNALLSVGTASVLGDIVITGLIWNTALRDSLAVLFDAVGGTTPGSNFLIDHPLQPADKLLSHAAVKSPDLKNLYDGIATLDAKGEATVSLPDWFSALNSDFRYQLTAMGAPAPNLHVAERIVDKSFKIAGGTERMEVCWQVTGIRRDPWAKRNPVRVEQNKAVNERGYYVHPEVYQQPADRNIQWIRKPEFMRLLKEQQNAPETVRRRVQEEEARASKFEALVTRSKR
jgi:hypothetical protein